jgi:hypothetical protein
MPSVVTRPKLGSSEPVPRPYPRRPRRRRVGQTIFDLRKLQSRRPRRESGWRDLNPRLLDPQNYEVGATCENRNNGSRKPSPLPRGSLHSHLSCPQRVPTGHTTAVSHLGREVVRRAAEPAGSSLSGRRSRRRSARRATTAAAAAGSGSAAGSRGGSGGAAKVQTPAMPGDMMGQRDDPGPARPGSSHVRSLLPWAAITRLFRRRGIPVVPVGQKIDGEHQAQGHDDAEHRDKRLHPRQVPSDARRTPAPRGTPRRRQGLGPPT